MVPTHTAISSTAAAQDICQYHEDQNEYTSMIDACPTLAM